MSRSSLSANGSTALFFINSPRRKESAISLVCVYASLAIFSTGVCSTGIGEGAAGGGALCGCGCGSGGTGICP
jgi:hypothetical protein